MTNSSLLRTGFSWADLRLSTITLKKIVPVKNWLKQQPDNGTTTIPATGYRVLLSGQSLAVKTLTANLLGEEFKQPVYTIDLSKVISRYIGETAKNLDWIFSAAATKNGILFFDEADALFGKRTTVKDAHDKYANAEIAYLLQRMENYTGLSILAANIKGKMNVAFSRRFESVINFPVPTAAERLALWQQALSAIAPFAADVDLPAIAKKYLLTHRDIQLVAKQVAAALTAGEPISAGLLLASIEAFYKSLVAD